MKRIVHTLLFATLLWACGGSDPGPTDKSGEKGSSASTDEDGSPGGGTGPSEPVPTHECQTACEAKAVGCGAPEASASELCRNVCNGTTTEAQLSCLSTKSCKDLAQVEGKRDLDRLCPASDAGGSTDACVAGKTTCNAAGDSTVECSSVGYPMTVRCSQGKCKDGQCGACTTKSDCNGGYVCKCKDGNDVLMTADVDCVSGECKTEVPDCTSSCAPHGGI